MDNDPIPSWPVSRGRLLAVAGVLLLGGMGWVTEQAVPGMSGRFLRRSVVEAFPGDRQGHVDLLSNFHKTYTLFHAPVSGTYHLHVQASGTPCMGLWPRLGVTVDGASALQLTLPGPGMADLWYPVFLKRGLHQISLALLNDEFQFPEDVNARVHALEVSVLPPPPSAVPRLPVTRDADALPYGAGEYVRDDVRVILAGGWVSSLVWCEAEDEVPVFLEWAEPPELDKVEVSLAGRVCHPLHPSGLVYPYTCRGGPGVAPVMVRHTSPALYAAAEEPMRLKRLAVGQLLPQEPRMPTLNASPLRFVPGMDGELTNAWLGSRGWALAENGFWSVRVHNPVRIRAFIRIRLSGATSGPHGPWALVLVDRRQVARLRLDEPPATHSLWLQLAPGIHQVLVAFMGDSVAHPGDQRLFLEDMVMQ